MAYTYTETGHGNPTTILRSDGYEFPQDPTNQAYQDWLAFTAGGGSTTGATPESLEDKVDRYKHVVDNMASDQRAAVAGNGPHDGIYLDALFAEAVAYEADGSPDPEDYPLLAAQIPGRGANVDAVHDAVLTQRTAMLDRFAVIDGVVQEAYTDLEGESTDVAMDAILAAIDWTP